jgi:hypothetical protein
VGSTIARTYRLGSEKELDVTDSISESYRQRFQQGLTSFFLPEGYPHSVTPDYLEFQVWDSLQALSSYLRGIASTQAVLVGLGVGNDEASALSATVSWIIRDGMGMLGGALFAWQNASAFGNNIKFWRLFADVINDVALIVELVAPLLPKQYFLAAISLASVGKALCGVSAGATRAALTAHFAQTRNLSDVSAKEGIQENVVTLLGMVAGLYFSQLMLDDVWSTWIFFLSLTLFHVYANYKGMKALIFRTIDTQRAHILLEDHFTRADSHQTLSPLAVSQRERIRYSAPEWVQLGVSFSEFDIQSAQDLKTSCERKSTTGTEFLLDATNKQVLLSLQATGVDVFQALFYLCSHKYTGEASTQAKFDSFLTSLDRQGWDTKSHRITITTGPWRSDWKKAL